ncbi:MAG: SDR family oxidoreductase [Propionicimonas sp.]
MTGSTVVVTGSSGGIGAATCRRLRAAGWHVVGLDVAPAPADSDWVTLPTDLARPGAAREAIRALLGRGATPPVAGVVHAAAVQVVAPAGGVAPEDWIRTLQVNLVALDEIVAEVRGELRESFGAVVAVGSVHARATTPGIAAYASSKAALCGWVRAAALDLAPEVRVNAVLPGATDTPMLRAGLVRRPEDGDEETAMAVLAAKVPARTVADPDDVARAIGFLLDRASSAYITGAELLVDGGVLAKLSSE